MQHREPRQGAAMSAVGSARSATANVALAVQSRMVIRRRYRPYGHKEEELELTVEAEANQYIPSRSTRSIWIPIWGGAEQRDEVEVSSPLAQGKVRTGCHRRVRGLEAAVMDVDPMPPGATA